MLKPKDYFKQHYQNKEKNFSIKSDDLNLMTIDLSNIEVLLNNDNKLNVNSATNYSNDSVIDEILHDFFVHSEFACDKNIYVGKLNNAYPNCYALMDKDLEGCLICITSGLTDNSFVFAEYISLLEYLEKEQTPDSLYLHFKNIIEYDIVNRIQSQYGGEVVSEDIVVLSEQIAVDNFFSDFQIHASAVSCLSDLFLIMHEYSHFLLNTYSETIHKKAFLIKVIYIYSSFCEKNPAIENILPKTEVLADFGALFLFSEFSKLDENSVTAIILAIFQLNRISPTDDYTNKYRLTVINYFLNEYRKVSPLIIETVQSKINKLYKLFEFADSSEKNKNIKNKAFESFKKILFSNKDNIQYLLALLKHRSTVLEKILGELKTEELIKEKLEEFEEFDDI